MKKQLFAGLFIFVLFSFCDVVYAVKNTEEKTEIKKKWQRKKVKRGGDSAGLIILQKYAKEREELQKLRKKDPEAFEAKSKELRKKIGKEIKAEREKFRKLVMEYRKSQNPKTREAISKYVSDAYERRIDAAEKRIAAQKERLKKAEERLAELKSKKEERINKKLKVILKDPKLSW